MTFQLADLSEKQLMAQARELATMLGWWTYHPLRSRGSQPGWPDLSLIREREVKIELKAEGGKVSPAQKTVIRLLLEARSEIYVVRPRDLDALAAVLAWRGDPLATGPIRARDQLRAQTRAEVAA